MDCDWIENIYWIHFILQRYNITSNLLIKVGLLSKPLDEKVLQ